MSGHSKWSTIKHQKGITDAKKSKVFSMYSKLISMSVREGSSDDPEFNPKLRMLISKARFNNMPKDKIQNAIDKGAGRIEGVSYETVAYEGFSPEKVALIVECVTDNRNRTNSEVKSLINKNGGIVGSAGSVGYFFDKKGMIVVEIPVGAKVDDLELKLMDFDIEDFSVDLEDNVITVYVEASATHLIAEEMKKAGLEIKEIEVIMKPNTFVELDERQMELFDRFYDLIDDNEDVQKIYHNAKIAG